MTKKRYQWSASFHPIADAQVVGEELERIRESEDGKLTVESMLEAARPEEAPLHPLCTWDDAIAAEYWRKVEIRRIPQKLQVINEDRPEPAYVNIRSEVSTKAGYYQETRVAVQNIDEYELAFRHAYQRVSQAQQALNDLERIASNANEPRDRERMALIRQVDQALQVSLAALAQAA